MPAKNSEKLSAPSRVAMSRKGATKITYIRTSSFRFIFRKVMVSLMVAPKSRSLLSGKEDVVFMSGFVQI